MVKCDIKFLVRILPSPSRDWECVKVEKNKRTIHIRSSQTYSIHPDRTLYWEFNTDGIVTDSCQDVIYNMATENTLGKVFKGVDMLIFAFGQSDTGKTYTMLGLEDGYTYRGIAPRLLKDTMVMAKKYGPGMDFFIDITFLEFDNGKCYNLLTSPPTHIDHTKIKGTPIKSVKEGLGLLFDGLKRRKYENKHNHCAPGVITMHIRGLPVSGTSTSNIYSFVHLVDCPGTEKQFTNVRSHNCQSDANLVKLELDVAKTWDGILARQNGGCQVMGRCPAVFKCSNLIQYLGRSISNGVVRLIGHIRAEHKDLKNTLWTLKYGGRLSRKPPGEMVYTFTPDYMRLAQLLEEEVKQLRDEIVVSELLRGEYTQLNMCQGEMEHMQRLAKSYIEGHIAESSLLSAAKPNVILHALRKVYINDIGDITQAFKVKLKKAADTLTKELSSNMKKKKEYGKDRFSSPENPKFNGLPQQPVTRSPSKVGTMSSNALMKPSTTTTTAQAGEVKDSLKPDTGKKDNDEAKSADNKSRKQSTKQRTSLTKKASKVAGKQEEVKEEVVKMPDEALEDGRKTRLELWAEWESKNSEAAEKLKGLKEELKLSSEVRDAAVADVSNLRTKLQALQVELEEARWQRMVNFGEHPGIDGARLVTSAAEQTLEDEIKQLKKEIYEKVAHMVNDHKEHMRKYNDFNNEQTIAENKFQSYVLGSQRPLVLFPPMDEMDIVPLNPMNITFKGFQEEEGGRSSSEIEFTSVQATRYRNVHNQKKNKWH